MPPFDALGSLCPSSSKPLEIEVSADLLESNPILDKRGLVLNEAAYASLGSHLDEAFFAISRLPLD